MVVDFSKLRERSWLAEDLYALDENGFKRLCSLAQQIMVL